MAKVCWLFLQMYIQYSCTINIYVYDDQLSWTNGPKITAVLISSANDHFQPQKAEKQTMCWQNFPNSSM